MDTPLTLSKMADMIIVICFFSIGFSAFLYLLMNTIHEIADWIRAIRKARKERKRQSQSDESEQAQDRTAGQTE